MPGVSRGRVLKIDPIPFLTPNIVSTQGLSLYLNAGLSGCRVGRWCLEYLAIWFYKLTVPGI